MKEFVTIEESVKTEIVEKKSKFIANLFYIENVDEAEKIIKETRKKYFDARHNCIAYRVIDKEQLIEKSSDDGEPSGTAGAPMLNILQKNNLVNVLIIVTRYFGGILLGTGGLVRAYSNSLLEAVGKSKKVKNPPLFPQNDVPGRCTEVSSCTKVFRTLWLSPMKPPVATTSRGSHGGLFCFFIGSGYLVLTLALFAFLCWCW